MRPQSRDKRIDSVKYWLIVLVIIGHVLRGKPFAENYECTVLMEWLYIFHMPLFIFISGYFSHKQNVKELPKSIWKLLEPLIIFQAIFKIQEFIYNGTISINSILHPGYTLWYLLSLIYWRLLLQIIPDKIINNSRLLITLTLIISIFSGFLPFNELLSIQRTLAFMPFFFLGYCMKGKKIFLPKKYRLTSAIFLTISIFIPIFFSNYLGNLIHSTPYISFYSSFSRILVFCISIPMSLAFTTICPTTEWSEKQGKYTMQYYLYHALTIPCLMKVIIILDLPTSLFAAAIYSFIITIGIGILLKIPYIHKLTNPSSLIKK